MVFTINSCDTDDENTVKLSISYFQDLKAQETINTIISKNLISLESPNLGFKNGIYWFKVVLDKSLNDNPIVFDLPESKIDNITIYSESKIILYKKLDNTHQQLMVDSKNNIFFFKVYFNKEVFFSLNVKKYTVSQLNEKYIFFKNGIYYGFVLMVLIINIFFYFSLKDKTFLFYCSFLIIITIIMQDYDGLLNTFLPRSFLPFISLITHFMLAFTGALFANQFLNIKYYLPKSNGIGIFLLFITMCSYLLFIPTQKFLFIAIGDTFSMLVLFHYWFVGIIISKKYKFAKFFVLGYSLILLSSFLFILPRNWGLNMMSVSLNTVKFSSFFEMLILTYAITYRVNILQKENEKFKTEIQEYLSKIDALKTGSDETNKTNIDVIISENNLSEREADVLLLIFKGYTNQRIGDELFVSLNTVKYHVRNIYQKLNIKSKNEAIDILTNIKR